MNVTPARWTGTLLAAGTSHHVTPVAMRERLLGKGGERAAEALTTAVRARLGPAVVLSTCNRLEVYCWTTRRNGAATLVRILSEWSGLPRADLAPHLYLRRGADAAYHLVRVAAGLDSLAVGESQVLGQVRAAWQAARHPDCDGASASVPGTALGPELDGVFRRAIEAARRIRRLGHFDRHPSVAGIAVARASGALGSLEGRPCAVLGAGVTGQEAMRLLLVAGAAAVTLLNRSRHRVARMQGALPPHLADRVRFATLDALPETLAGSDVLISATAAPDPVVTPAIVAEALNLRRGATGNSPVSALLLIDIAVPRDVHPAVREIAGVTVFDLDDLASGCAADATARRAALDRADALAREAADAFTAELRLRAAAPDVATLREHAEAVRLAELRRVRGRLAGLSPRQLAAVEQLTHTIMRKLLHPPTMALRDTARLSPTVARRHRAGLLASTVPAPPKLQERRPDDALPA
ncbi:MAG: Glutamyl-tRNA reductase [uncultured Chloroflexi bacterium]|uniref:Glutamyl-tRNA reductase n=1 Tax=uncultured Chloroflexota bacterium TaxID=166587 RepID=A0A6J4HHU7_9CHLR|nr:MAG: Glutamyl-tRNA reductase [uncultured Chloroflexota bacterium]